MKITIIAGVMVASVLLGGCGKKNGSSNNSALPTNAQPDATSSVTQADATAQEIHEPVTDAEFRQKVTGVWKGNNKILGSTIEYTFTFAPNGNYAKQSVISHGTEKKNSTAFGTWQIKDGVLITTVTRIDPMPQGAIGGDLAKGLANGMADSHKIINVNDHELTIEIDVYTITGNGGHGKTKGTMTWTR
jgi:major membrane immunogen (membrane-anchored lipoprotein)